MLTDKERAWIQEMIKLGCSEGGPYAQGVQDLTKSEVLILFSKLGLDVPHPSSDVYFRRKDD